MIIKIKFFLLALMIVLIGNYFIKNYDANLIDDIKSTVEKSECSNIGVIKHLSINFKDFQTFPDIPDPVDLSKSEPKLEIIY